eukprot:13860-Prymnesium_polylepis.1
MARHGAARCGTARSRFGLVQRAAGVRGFGDDGRDLDRLDHRLVLLRRHRHRLLLQALWPVVWARSEHAAKVVRAACARGWWDSAPQVR